jgi:hypothetical protein
MPSKAALKAAVLSGESLTFCQTLMPNSGKMDCQ